mmetsp:Transcript_30627/g.60638  ORF Transcript_30627/g.60638 Transcript_30627/m.60638 type:complete len:89 (+) Transcript_30627:711-977(+)
MCELDNLRIQFITDFQIISNFRAVLGKVAKKGEMKLLVPLVVAVSLRVAPRVMAVVVLVAPRVVAAAEEKPQKPQKKTMEANRREANR